MNSDVFFQDVGFTKDAGVPPEDGEPWAEKRYDDVDWTDPTTWRDSTFERTVQILADPDAVDHFYADDGYGDVTA